MEIQSHPLQRVWDCTNKSEVMVWVDRVDLHKHLNGQISLLISIKPHGIQSNWLEFRLRSSRTFAYLLLFCWWRQTYSQKSSNLDSALQWYIFCQFLFNHILNFPSSCPEKKPTNPQLLPQRFKAIHAFCTNENWKFGWWSVTLKWNYSSQEWFLEY